MLEIKIMTKIGIKKKKISGYIKEFETHLKT